MFAIGVPLEHPWYTGARGFLMLQQNQEKGINSSQHLQLTILVALRCLLLPGHHRQYPQSLHCLL
jgi:hypothetical protein